MDGPTAPGADGYYGISFLRNGFSEVHTVPRGGEAGNQRMETAGIRLSQTDGNMIRTPATLDKRAKNADGGKV